MIWDLRETTILLLTNSLANSEKDCLFNRGWMKLDEAVPGSLKLVPEGDFRQALMRDYQAMQGMMLGDIPTFGEIVDSISALEADVNSMSSNL
jgi:hypothetical protein